METAVGYLAVVMVFALLIWVLVFSSKREGERQKGRAEEERLRQRGGGMSSSGLPVFPHLKRSWDTVPPVPDAVKPATPVSKRSTEMVDYYAYLRSPAWQAQRRMAIARAGNKCQLCGTGGELHAHHNSYERLGNEAPEDLIMLCGPCHRAFHARMKIRKA